MNMKVTYINIIFKAFNLAALRITVLWGEVWYKNVSRITEKFKNWSNELSNVITLTKARISTMKTGLKAKNINMHLKMAKYDRKRAEYNVKKKLICWIYWKTGYVRPQKFDIDTFVSSNAMRDRLFLKLGHFSRSL